MCVEQWALLATAFGLLFLLAYCLFFYNDGLTTGIWFPPSYFLLYICHLVMKKPLEKCYDESKLYGDVGL